MNPRAIATISTDCAMKVLFRHFFIKEVLEILLYTGFTRSSVSGGGTTDMIRTYRW
jgi:hypothetical protein